jgi:predicted GNAT family N-acyltransferase
LRHEILRAGRPFEDSFYAPDDLPDTMHIAVFADDQIVGAATVFPEPYRGEPAWRLRGMAVDANHQGFGVGTLIMKDIFRRMSENGVQLLWCNARSTALDFYRKQGFEVVGDEFIADADVPHYRAILHV